MTLVTQLVGDILRHFRYYQYLFIKFDSTNAEYDCTLELVWILLIIFNPFSRKQ